MSSGQQLTAEKLLDLVETESRTFSDDYLPFTHKQSQAVKKCSDLLAQDRTRIRRNIPKARAHIILSDIWAQSPEIFVLCALTTNPTSLSSLKSQDYLRILLGWWNKGHHLKGLTEAINRHLDIFPERAVTPGANVTRKNKLFQ